MAAPAVVAVCDCDRQFFADDENGAWKLLQQHIEEFGAVDDALHALREFETKPWPGMKALTDDEVLATHAADLERQWMLAQKNDPTADSFEEWSRHLMEYLSLAVHKQHPRTTWEDCTNPACVWARAAVRHGR